MNVDIEPLRDVQQTGKKMYQLVDNYYNDLFYTAIPFGYENVPVTSLSIEQWFDVLKNMPYRRDREPIEVVGRPSIILSAWQGDCKKKSICMASLLVCKRKPFRYIACSERKDLEVHHVFVQGFLFGSWCNLDCTYKQMRPYEDKTVTYAEVLQP